MVQCITSSLLFVLNGPVPRARISKTMKILEIQLRSPLGDVVDVIAQVLGHNVAKPSAPGWFARLLTRLWRRQLRGVDAYMQRADALSAALDRWLWKQRMRETEAWLAQSKDVFELEARIRALERGPCSHIF